MRRRTFIQIVGTSALGLPFMCSQFKLASPQAPATPERNIRRVPLRLDFTPEESGVLSVLRHRAKAVCLVGGGVLAKAAGVALPYANLLTDSKEFGALKNDLFSYGVEPISTPRLPSHFIKFVCGGKPFSVLNLDLDDYLERSVMAPRVPLVPLAHNFLVYSVGGEWVFDPYGALQERGGRRTRSRVKVLEEPKHPIPGLELCLAVAFDTALLRLEQPAGHAAFESRVLAATVQNEAEATVVFHQVLSFFPDLLELQGWKVTRKYLASRLCVSAGARGPGIDLARVAASLQRFDQRGVTVSSTHLVAAINNQMEHVANRPGFGTGLPDYMVAKKLSLRRTDLMSEALRHKEWS